jgi:hypothetical protein
MKHHAEQFTMPEPRAKRPATRKLRELHGKLAALVERGVDGEQASAQRKLARLEARYDFAAPAIAKDDLFAGTFHRSTYAAPVHTFSADHLFVAANVKWAIEQATGIACQFAGPQLQAQAEPRTAARLAAIAATIAESFAALWQRYATAGAHAADRGLFVLGLYDGMMNETRSGALPNRPSAHVTAIRAKRRALTRAPGLNLHPYSVAVNLGRAIRFTVPLEEVTHQLDQTIAGQLAA